MNCYLLDISFFIDCLKKNVTTFCALVIYQKNEYTGYKRKWHQYLPKERLDDNCIFCKIAAGEIPSETVYEDEQFRAILDLGPASAGHTLILPKAHFKDVTEISDEYAANVLKVAAKLGKAMKKGLGCEGFNLVQNNGEAAGQTVFHFHMHVIPRYAGGEDMVSWDPKPAKREELEKQGAKLREALKD